MASITNQPVDRLSTYPIACGVNRRLVGDGKMTYPRLGQRPEEVRRGRHRRLQVLRLGLVLRPDGPVRHGRRPRAPRPHGRPEHPVRGQDHHPQPGGLREAARAGRARRAAAASSSRAPRCSSEKLENDIITSGFLEGPLLALTQTAGAEKVFMDMINNRSAVHKGLETMTQFDVDFTNAFATTAAPGLCWDYLWGNYSCLGDKEYDEFEGQHKYAGKLNELTTEGRARPSAYTTAPTCPTWTRQVKAFKPVIYTMAYYPLIPGSPIAQGGHRQGLRGQLPARREDRPPALRARHRGEDGGDHHEADRRSEDRAVPAGPALPVRDRFRLRGPARRQHQDREHQGLRRHRQEVRPDPVHLNHLRGLRPLSIIFLYPSRTTFLLPMQQSHEVE